MSDLNTSADNLVSYKVTKEVYTVWIRQTNECFTSQVPGGTEISSLYSDRAPFRTYELLNSGTFHVIFLDCGRPWITETSKRETTDKEGITVLRKIIY